MQAEDGATNYFFSRISIVFYNIYILRYYYVYDVCYVIRRDV